MLRNTRFELNQFEFGMIIGDDSDTQVLVEGNVFASLGPQNIGVWMFPANRGTGISGSSLWFGRFSDVKCQAVNNEFYGVAMPYVLNDPCKVVAEK